MFGMSRWVVGLLIYDNSMTESQVASEVIKLSLIFGCLTDYRCTNLFSNIKHSELL